MSQQGYSESAQVELKYNLLKSIEAKGYNFADEWEGKKELPQKSYI